MTTDVRVGTVELDSFTMDYFTFGHGGETLVIIPGLIVQSVVSLAPAVAEAYQLLADECTVYVLDRRKNAPETYSIRDMTRDTAQALRALGLEHVSILGASQGGMIAMVMAIDQPDLVRKMVLCSTAARMEEASYRSIEQWIKLAEAKDVEGLYLALGKAIYPQSVFEESRGLLTEAAKGVTDEDLARFIVLAKGLRGFDVIDDLEKITCPVLAIGSKDDRILGCEPTLQIAERLGKRANFELHLYDGYGHATYDTAPDFKERVLRFLMSNNAS